MEDYGHLILTRKPGDTIEITTPSGVLEIMTGVIEAPWVHVTFSSAWRPSVTEWIGEGEKFPQKTPDGPIFVSLKRFIYNENHDPKAVSVAIDAPRSWNIARGELVNKGGES